MIFLFRCLIVLLIVPLALAAQKVGEKKSPTPAQIVFVCEHGAAKSIIAASYFNKLASERGFPQRAIARGTQPDPTYAPSVIQGLKDDGLEIDKGKPVSVTDADLAAAMHVVTLGCKLPHPPPSTANVRAWDDISMVEGYSAARRAIVKRVEQLLNEINGRR